MRFYGGKSKRRIKKAARSVFYIDGARYSWKKGLWVLEILSRLQPGHICYIPYIGRPNMPLAWGIIEQVEPVKRALFRGGWLVDEIVVHVRDKKGQIHYVYDVEQWFYRVSNEFTEQFNRQVGLPPDFHLRAGQFDLLSV